jgi:hypothetical protein
VRVRHWFSQTPSVRLATAKARSGTVVSSRRIRPKWSSAPSRFASQAGYVSTEIAKEIPYYAGAFGAALLSDSVSSNDALVFLAGANLGAAAYEYALGRLTRTFLRLRTRHAATPPRAGRPS